MKDKDGERQGSLSAAAIGLALHLAWTFATTFGTFSIAPGSELPDAFAGAGLPMPLVFLVAAVVEAIMLAAASVFMQGDPRLLYNKKVVTASAFIMAAATIAVFVAHPSGELGVVLSVIAGIAVGVGSAALILFWGIAFSRLSLASIALNTGIAVALSVIVYVLLVHVLPSSAQWVVAILPVLEVPFARLASPDRYAERRSLPLFRSFPVRRGPFALLLCAAMLLFGFSLGLLKAMSASSIQSTQDMVVQVVALLLACIAVPLLLSLVLYGGEEDARWDLLLRPLVVVVVLSAFITPVILTPAPIVALFLLFLCYVYVEAALWVFLVGVSQEFRLSPVFLVGIGRAALTVGTVAGAWLMSDTQLLAGLPQGYIGGVVVAAFVVGYVVNPRVALVKRAARKAQGLPLEEAPAQPQGSFAPHPDDPALQHVDDASAVVAGSAADERAAASSAGAAGAGAPSGAMPGQAAGGAAAQSETESIKQVCEEIAGRYLLSQRQTEVLYLLARGHNAAYIQDKLCITLSTAKSHIYNIYRKLDIHTQHELLAMVEESLEEEKSAK